MDKAWYLVYTKSRRECVAQEHLVRQNYHTYLPYLQVHRRRHGVYQLFTEPMFPRYLFIYLDEQNDNWGPIRSTRGVTSLVRFGGMPAKIPVDLIQVLQQRENMFKLVKNDTDFFQIGDEVQILDGVMAGYKGIFAAKSGAKRVTILLDIVGKTMRVEVPIDSIG